KALGIVRQNDTLFGGTIAENISFFDAGVALDTVQTAAASAQILDDIDEMPMKFQSLIGDMGSALSGGQKQRLLLARALYSEPSALILDEGTANLDPETEAKVVDVIKNLKMIRITVTHRVLINEHADSVYRLRSGILERVSHA
ncbi:MAG TPA: ATP-binding cassette domain-containing protein, partial [Bacteroidetes bacterium]|nr:ATP-binding cassette domain-containing protein [Bacteroidota bacterium]